MHAESSQTQRPLSSKECRALRQWMLEIPPTRHVPLLEYKMIISHPIEDITLVLPVDIVQIVAKYLDINMTAVQSICSSASEGGNATIFKAHRGIRQPWGICKSTADDRVINIGNDGFISMSITEKMTYRWPISVLRTQSYCSGIDWSPEPQIGFVSAKSLMTTEPYVLQTMTPGTHSHLYSDVEVVIPKFMPFKWWDDRRVPMSVFYLRQTISYTPRSKVCHSAVYDIDDTYIQHSIMAGTFFQLIGEIDFALSIARTIPAINDAIDAKIKTMLTSIPVDTVISGSLPVALYYGLPFVPMDIDILTPDPPEGKMSARDEIAYGTIPGLRAIVNLDSSDMQILWVDNVIAFIESFDLDICKLLMTKTVDGYDIKHLHGRSPTDLEIRFVPHLDPLRGRQTPREVSRLINRLWKYHSRGFHLRRGDLHMILDRYFYPAA